MSNPTTAQMAEIVGRAIETSGLSVNKVATESRSISRPTLERKLAGVGSFTIVELGGITEALGTTIAALLAAAEKTAAAA